MSTNTNGLARMYDKLTPWERLPLLMAARRRGDEVESGRLAATAPKITCQVPNHYGLAQAFTLVSVLHFLEVSRLATQFFATFALPDDTKKAEQAAVDSRVLVAHLFKTTLAGWRQFCAEFRFDPEWCWSLLPGADKVKRAVELLDGAVPGFEMVNLAPELRDGPNPAPESVRAALRRQLKRADFIPESVRTELQKRVADGPLTTADHVAAELRDWLHVGVAPWNPKAG
jgi:hypothetical protein